MENINLKTLGDRIVETFLNQDQYLLAKEVPEFKQNGVLVGDWFSYLMCDPTTNPPTFYEVTSPYDLVSKKAPQHALVFQDGKCILQTEYTDYVAMRTGIVDALLLTHLGITGLANKKVLICGTGRIASWSIKSLKAYFPDLQQITYLTKEKSDETFEKLATVLDIKATHTISKDPREFDVILCHTSTEASIFTDPSLIKKGAILAGFISSTQYGEFSDAFYNSDTANVLIDWEPNLSRMPYIERQIEIGAVDKARMGNLRSLFAGECKVNPDAKYTLFTSVGTPMQNIALLKLLVAAQK